MTNDIQGKFVIHMSQGQGDAIVDRFTSLEDALKYVDNHKGEGSFAIEYPDGSFHNWGNKEA